MVSSFSCQGPKQDGLRQVNLRFRETDTGTRSYMLCGQVHIGTGAKAAWADFATIKTDPYEQWLGGPATDMCAKATPVTGGRDLAPLLEQELGSKRSEEHTSELQSLMRISYAVFCLNKKNSKTTLL